MKIKIQRCDNEVRIHEIWTRDDHFTEETMKSTDKECGRIIVLAGIFMKMFPRFKEVTVSTELTEEINPAI